MKTLVLTDGLRVGDTVHKEVEFKDITAGDILEATEAAERIVTTRNGHAAAVVSDARLGMEILRRRIAKFGTLEMPLSFEELKKVSERDIDALQNAVEELDMTRKLSDLGRN